MDEFQLTAIQYPRNDEERKIALDKIKKAKKLQRLFKMHAKSGISEGKKCGDCKYLVSVEWNCKRYFKCALYGDSRCEATDWRKKWQACGRFAKNES